MRKLRVYLAGPISNYPKKVTHEWRESVENAFKDSPDVKIYNPCRRIYTQPMEECYKELVNMDLADIKKSDILLINPNVPMTEGTPMEVVYGRFWKKANILVRTDNVGAWMLYHADLVVEDLQAAIKSIRAWSTRLPKNIKV